MRNGQGGQTDKDDLRCCWFECRGENRKDNGAKGGHCQSRHQDWPRDAQTLQRRQAQLVCRQQEMVGGVQGTEVNHEIYYRQARIKRLGCMLPFGILNILLRLVLTANAHLVKCRFANLATSHVQWKSRDLGMTRASRGWRCVPLGTGLRTSSARARGTSIGSFDRRSRASLRFVRWVATT